MPRKRTDPEVLAERRAYWLGQDRDAATRDRLRWQYGGERADAIMDGKDDATNADVERWRRLGEPRDTIDQLVEAIGPALIDPA